MEVRVKVFSEGHKGKTGGGRRVLAQEIPSRHEKNICRMKVMVDWNKLHIGGGISISGDTQSSAEHC